MKQKFIAMIHSNNAKFFVLAAAIVGAGAILSSCHGRAGSKSDDGASSEQADSLGGALVEESVSVSFPQEPLKYPEIRTVKVDPNKFVTNEDDMLWDQVVFREVASFGGVPVKFGYDFNYLKFIVMVGDSVLLDNPWMWMESDGAKANTVTVTKHERTATIDFNSPSALDDLKAFTGAPKGYDVEEYRFVLKPEDAPEHSFMQPCVNMSAQLPADPKARKMMIAMIDNYPPLSRLSDDIEGNGAPEVKYATFRDLVVNRAEELINKSDNNLQFLPADTFFRPTWSLASNDAYEVVWESPEYVTIAHLQNQTYTSGGAWSMQGGYATFDKRTGRCVDARNLLDKYDKAVLQQGVNKAYVKKFDHYENPDLSEVSMAMGADGVYVNFYGYGDEIDNWYFFVPFSSFVK